MVKKKIYKVVWDRDATQDLKEIFYYIKKDSEYYARKVKSEILNSTRTLCSFPEIYPQDRFKQNNDGSYRAFILFHYRITYKISDYSIQIIRIRHTSREPIEY